MIDFILDNPDWVVSCSKIILSVVAVITAIATWRAKHVKPILLVNVDSLGSFLKHEYSFSSIIDIANGSVYPVQIQEVYLDFKKNGRVSLNVNYDDPRTVKLPVLMAPGSSISLVHSYSELSDGNHGFFKNEAEVLKVKVIIITSCGTVAVSNPSIRDWAKRLSKEVFKSQNNS